MSVRRERKTRMKLRRLDPAEHGKTRRLWEEVFSDDTKAFLDVAEPIYQAVLNNSIENLRLSELRDSLLPKLMNGEIDVTDIRL